MTPHPEGAGMKTLTHLCLALLCITLASCGCGSKGGTREVRGMTLADLQAKLDGLKTPVEIDCDECGGKKKIMSETRGVEVDCKTCKGTGKIKEDRGITVEEFHDAIGEPLKTTQRDLIWDLWHYKVKEGTVTIEVFIQEARDDPIERVMTGKVQLIK